MQTPSTGAVAVHVGPIVKVSNNGDATLMKTLTS